jgi:hypothetical protein
MAPDWQLHRRQEPPGPQLPYQQKLGVFLVFSSLTDMETSKPSNGLSMTYATSAPATAGGQPGSPVRIRMIMMLAFWLEAVLPDGCLIDSHYPLLVFRARGPL